MILVKGYWPQVEPAFWSVALLRWDITSANPPSSASSAPEASAWPSMRR